MFRKTTIMAASIIVAIYISPICMLGQSQILPFINEIDRVETVASDLFYTDVIAIDKAGNVYMSGYKGNRGTISPKPFIKITPEGKTSVLAEIKKGRPGGIHFDDRTGYLYAQIQLTEDRLSECQLIRIDKNGGIEIVLDRIEKVAGLTVDTEGNIFLSGAETNRLTKVTPSGKVEVFASGPMFDVPLSMVFDPQGNMFCSNWADGKIHKITPTGDISLFAKLPGNKNVLGWLVYHQGDIYATGFESHRVYKVDNKGNVYVIAGSGIRGVRDGSPEQARFFHPNGLNISPAGDFLYVADWVGEGQRQTLRKLYFKK